MNNHFSKCLADKASSRVALSQLSLMPSNPGSGRLSVLIAASLFLAAFSPLQVRAEDYFNPAALEGRVPLQSPLDLTLFAKPGAQTPGHYRVDLVVNGNELDVQDVNFTLREGQLQPELTLRQWADFGVKVEAFPALQALPMDEIINDIGHYITDANTKLDFNRLRLEISIPQAALHQHARGFIDPNLWDQGLPALFTNYSFSGANSQRDQSTLSPSSASSSYYLNLRSGINLGAWRLRNYSTYSKNEQGQQQWNSLNTYLQRDVQPLKGQLTLGDGQSESWGVFESVPFRGIQLASDDSMLPDSQRGFAPVIRGIAKSNAQVTVEQNGNILYQTYVAPGAFVIDDLYPTSLNGELTLIIKEANGEERRSVQSFSSVPIMEREGRLKYAITAGEYRANQQNRTPYFAQSTLIYGLPYNTSSYGGALVSNRYNSVQLGLGHGFGHWGSLSADVTQAQTTRADHRIYRGQSYRIQYAKALEVTNTSFRLAGYRYSTAGYYDFQEANQLDNRTHFNYNKRSRAQLDISQSLGDYGSVYFTAYQQDFWRRTGFETSLSAGYNTSYRGVGYSLSYTHSQRPEKQGKDQLLALNISLSLSQWLPNSWMNYGTSSGKGSGMSHRLGLSGSALANNNLNYNLQQSYTHQKKSSDSSVSGSYRGQYGTVSGGYNYNSSGYNVNYAMQGGIVAHPYGITLSQSLGETMTLVRAPGANKVKISNHTGVMTDGRGYAVIPSVSAYRFNRIELNTQSLGDNVDLETSTQTVVPTRGALVLANFNTRVGSRVLMTLHYQGNVIPFGAIAALQVKEGSMENSSIVGAEGQVYLSGMPEQGQLKVQWGEGEAQQCQVDFTLPAVTDHDATVRMLKAECRNRQ